MTSSNGLLALDPSLLPAGSTILHTAASSGNLEACGLILEESSSNLLESMDHRNWTPLSVALHNGRMKVACLLLQHGASTSASFDKNVTIGKVLESPKYSDFAQELVESGVGIGSFMPTVVFHTAAFDGKAAVLDSCISLYGIDVNHVDLLGRTALHEAVLNGHLECVDVLVKHRANLEVYDSVNFSPFHYACRCGSVPMVTKLLEVHTSEEIQRIMTSVGVCGCTPLHLALEYRHYDVASVLLRECPPESLDTADNCFVTSHNLIQQAFLSGKISLNDEFFFQALHLLHSDFKITLLHQTIHEDKEGLARRLIASGVNFEGFDVSLSHNCLLLASRLGRTAIVKVLLSEGANVCITDPARQTPLHLAAHYGHSETVQCLLSSADVPLNAVDMKNYTALDLAILHRQAAVVEVFLAHYESLLNPPNLPHKKQTLSLLSEWADGRILNRFGNLLGPNIFEILASQETCLPTSDNPLNVVGFPQTATQSPSPGSPTLVDLRRAKSLPKGALRRYRLCLYCLKLVGNIEQHFDRCRVRRVSGHPEGLRFTSPQHNIYACNKELLQYYGQRLSKQQSQSYVVNTNQTSPERRGIEAKQKAVWKRLCSNTRNRHRKMSAYNFYPLHTAAYAGNSEFLAWIFSRTTSTEQQRALLESENGAKKSLMEVIVTRGIENSISSLIDSRTFSELEQHAKERLQPHPPTASMEPVVRRTYSMRIHKDVKTTRERALDIIQKKKEGRKMRYTDSDYTLLCHMLYHNFQLSNVDANVIMDMLISRSKIAGTRTLPCKCRCVVFSNAVNLRLAVEFILKCYRAGLSPTSLKSIVEALCRHTFIRSGVQNEDVHSMSLTAQQQREWWGVFRSMSCSNYNDLLCAVCLYGNASQAAVLLPWCTGEDGLKESQFHNVVCVVKRKHPELLRQLLENSCIPDGYDYAEVLTLCCSNQPFVYSADSVISEGRVNKRLINVDPFKSLYKDYEQGRTEVLEIMLERVRTSSCSNDLDRGLSVACKHRWWKAVSLIFENGANPLADFPSRTFTKRYVFLEVLRSNNTALFSKMLPTAVEKLREGHGHSKDNDGIVKAIVGHLPVIFAGGLYSELQLILESVPGIGSALWEGSFPMAGRLKGLHTLNKVDSPSFPMPDDVSPESMKAMARFGLCDNLRLALDSMELPEDVDFSELIHWAAVSGDYTTLEIVYSHLDTYRFRLVKECEDSAARRAVQTPWTDSESLFWSVALFSAVSSNCESLAIKTIDKIVSSPSRKQSLIKVRGNCLSALHWVCYWGMSELLSTTDGLTHETFVDNYHGPLTPLDCAIGTANFGCIAHFISKSDLIPKLVESDNFYGLYEEGIGDEDSYLMCEMAKVCCSIPVCLYSNGDYSYRAKSFVVSRKLAGLFHLLTLGWFNRLMSSNAQCTSTSRSNVSRPLYSQILHLRTAYYSTIEDRPHFLAMSLQIFLSGLVDGRHHEVRSFLEGQKVTDLKESLLMLLVEEGSLPIMQLASLSQSVDTINAVLECLSSTAIRKKIVDFSNKTFQNSSLLVAASVGAPECVSRLLASGGSLKFRNKASQNVLHLAVMSKSFETVCVLLEQKTISVLVLDKDKYGDTPVSLAVDNGQFEMLHAMKSKVPAKRWKEEVVQNYKNMFKGWFRCLMQGNDRGWKEAGFSTTPSPQYSLCSGKASHLSVANEAASCNNPHVLYAVIHVCGEGIVSQICGETKNYTEALAEVALLEKSLFLPHVDVIKLISSVKQAGCDKASVDLLREKLGDNPLFFSDPTSASADFLDEVFTHACESGSQRLISCLMDFGVLHTCSKEQLGRWFETMLKKGHIEQAATFLFQTDLSPTFESEHFHSPLLLSIFDQNFDLPQYFNGSDFRMGVREYQHQFYLPEAWLSYTWSAELSQIAQRNPSLRRVADLRNNHYISLLTPGGNSLEVSFDWRGFDNVARSVAENCDRLENCPLLTECIVFSSLVIPHIGHLWDLISEDVSYRSVYVSVVMSEEARAKISYSPDCHITLSYSTSSHAFTFPDVPMSPMPVEPLPPIPKPSLKESVGQLACRSIYPLVKEAVGGRAHRSVRSLATLRQHTTVEVADLEDLWEEYPDQQRVILDGIVSLFHQVEDVLLTILSSSYKLFDQRPVSALECMSGNFEQHKVLYSSVVSVARPVLNTLKAVHFNVTCSSSSSPGVMCSLENHVLEVNVSLCWLQEGWSPFSDDNVWLLKLPSMQAMLEALSSCLLCVRAQQLVNRLVHKLCLDMKCSTIDNTSLSIVLPDEKRVEHSDDSRTQAAILKWLVLGKSGLLTFLNLVKMLGRQTSLYSTLRDYLFNGFCIEVHVSHSPALVTDRGWLTLVLSMEEQNDDIDTLCQSICTFGRLNLKKHTLGTNLSPYVFPSQCRVANSSVATLYYPVLGKNSLTIELCDYRGDLISRESDNLCRVEVKVMFEDKRICECVWTPEMEKGTEHQQSLVIRKESHNSLSVTWNSQVGDVVPGLYHLGIKINREHILRSPLSVFLGSSFSSKSVPSLFRPRLPSRYLHHNREQINPWFLPQDRRGATLCGTGRPLVFHLQHNNNNNNNNNCVQYSCGHQSPKVDVPARIRKNESGIIVRVPVSYSRQSSTTGNSPTTDSLSSSPSYPLGTSPEHHLTMCARRNGLKSWICYEAGPVQVFIQPKEPGASYKIDGVQWRKRIRVHCIQLGKGEYRLSIMQSWCGVFLMMASCSLCHSVLTIHTSTTQKQVTASQQVMCTVLPGVIDPHQTLVASSVEELESLSSRKGQKDNSIVTKVKAGTEVSFFLQFLDLYGNRITQASIPDHPVSISIDSREFGYRRHQNTQCKLTSVGLGRFEAKCTLCLAGVHPISVGEYNLPVRVEATASDVHPANTLCSNWQRELTCGVWTCVVELYDQYGNACSSWRHLISAVFAVSVGERRIHERAEVRELPDPGKYKLVINCHHPGVYEVEVKVGNVPIPNMPIRFNVTLETSDKVKRLQSYLKSNWSRGATPTLTMMRDSLLETAINLLTDDMLRREVRVRFEGEVGIDMGGVSREFFELLGESLVNPNYALFEDIRGKFRPNPNSSVNPNHLFYFFFTGKVLAKTIADGHRLTIHFTPAVYKFLCGRTCTLEDLRDQDPALFSGLQQVANCSNEDDLKSLGLNFTAEVEHFGSVVVTELEPGGYGREVTLANRDLYIQKVLEYHLEESIREQLQMMKKGFNMLIPQDYLLSFAPYELELLISGLRVVDVDVLESKTKYTDYNKSSLIIQWLWEILREYPEDMKGKFLQFCSGSSQLPASFMHWNFRIARTHNSGQLPTAATCSNQLTLPDYRTKKELEEKLLTAISMGIHSFHVH